MKNKSKQMIIRLPAKQVQVFELWHEHLQVLELGRRIKEGTARSITRVGGLPRIEGGQGAVIAYLLEHCPTPEGGFLTIEDAYEVVEGKPRFRVKEIPVPQEGQEK